MKKKLVTAGLTLATLFVTAPAANAITVPDLGNGIPRATDFDFRGVDTYGNLATAHTWASDGTTPIVILGARLNPDCAPPGVLNERLDRAAEFLRVHPTNPVIVTGGATQSGCVTEAAAMEMGMRLRGVPNPIIQENRSGSTVGNAQNVAAMRSENKMVLVSSTDHLPRAQANFRAVGIETAAAALL